jgi:hypothetical protein
VDWGLILRDPAGRWPDTAADRLTEIRAAENVSRPLHRRVIRLRSNYLAFPVPSPQMRRAFVALCGPRSVRAPRRKLQRISRAVDEAYHSFAAGALEVRRSRAVSSPATGPRPGWPREWTEPEVDSWPWLLKEAEEPNLETRIGFAYHTDHMFRGRATWPDEAEIPLEERILCVLVRDLHIDHCRALQGLLHAIRYWRCPADPFASPVVAVGLADGRRGSDAFVVLSNDARLLPEPELSELNLTLRQTVRPIWSPAHVHFVDRLPPSCTWRIDK